MAITGVLLFISKAHAQDLGPGLEQLVLCEQNETARSAATQIQDQKGVKSDGTYFYKPTRPVKVFGYPVKYLGLHGVDLIPGPNVVVGAKATEVLKTLKQKTKKSFRPLEYWQEADLGHHLRILVYPHPKDAKLTFIQCGYFGP